MDKVTWMKITALLVSLGLSWYAIIGIIFFNVMCIGYLLSGGIFREWDWHAIMLMGFGDLVWFHFFAILKPWFKNEKLKYPSYFYILILILTFANKYFIFALFATPIILLYLTIVIGNYIDYEKHRD